MPSSEHLEQQRERIQDDLRGLVSGDVFCSNAYRQMYATDASVYYVRPLGVVRPRSVADVVACVQYAAAKQIPIHARGAGTSMAGESLGPGLVMDFSKYMHRIIRTDKEAVRVQAGVVCEHLNDHLRPRGRRFGPDPSSASVTTVGGMIAIDAAGSRRVKYGSTRDKVLGLQVVLADGRVLELGREPVAPQPDDDRQPRKRELVGQLTEVLFRYDDTIREYRRNRPMRRCGYSVDEVLQEGFLDFRRLICGSEGTLALVTEATLATDPIPRHRGVVLLLFDGLEKAVRAGLDIRAFGPSACDLMDRRHLALVREADFRLDMLAPREAESALLVEFEADEAVELRDRVNQVIEEIHHKSRRAFASRMAFEPSDVQLFWQLADRFQPAFCRVKVGQRPVPVCEDMAIPPEALPDFFVRVQNVLKRHEVTASVFAHVPHGQVHLRPFLDMSEAVDVLKTPALAADIYREAIEIGGSVGGENGCGLSRTPFLAEQCGPLYPAMMEIKRIFDPTDILNPGKIVGGDSGQLVRDLRPQAAAGAAADSNSGDKPSNSELRDLVELQLNWNRQQVMAAGECNGCGQCRTMAASLRMCPIFRLAPGEETTPRAKVNLIRGVLAGKLGLDVLKSDELKAIADLCVHCHLCRMECPAGVDTPRLMRECKGAYVAANGQSLADWFLSRPDRLGAIGSRWSCLANWAISNRFMRWLLEKTLGVAQGRKLPRFASKSFLKRADKLRLTKPSRRAGRKVLYFVDTYANYFDTQLAEAFVKVLEHNAVDVFVPSDQQGAGMAAIAAGALEYARRVASRNVHVLADAVRQGYHIVATEPTAVLCLTREYPQILDGDDDAQLVAKNASEACSYLWKLHVKGELQLDLNPVHLSLAYHLPCHLKVLQVGTPGRNLLSLVPGLQVQAIEAGCSGMAGVYGMLRKNYRNSLRVGMELINELRAPAFHAGTTECSACRLQMEQGTDKPTIHPIKILALAYGLMPELADRLTTPGGELVVA